MDPLTIGTLGIGALGSLGGLFSSAPAVPTYRDVNLARQNPDLWKQLQELQTMSAELDKQYKNRQQGATAGEMANIAQARGQAYERQGNQGLIGSSAGSSMMGRQEAEMQNALQQRIRQEQQALLAQAMQGRQAYASALQSAQQQQLAALQAQQQQAMGEQQSRNQFFGGIMNSGLGMYGTDRYLDRMADPEFRSNVFLSGRGRTGIPAINQPRFTDGYSYYQDSDTLAGRLSGEGQ